jgi:hypothetical protein
MIPSRYGGTSDLDAGGEKLKEICSDPEKQTLTIYVSSKISVSYMAFAINFMKPCKKRICIHGYCSS